jgi:hypothetical protein
VGDVLDIDAPRGDIGGDEHVDLAVAEGSQCLLPGALAEVAVDRGGRETALERSSATFAAVRLVRVKIRHRPRPRACSTRESSSTLSMACAR